jgi:hypothetical protein
MIYMVDIDGTICTATFGDYTKALPLTERIENLNRLYDEGHHLHYWTARGAQSGLDWKDLTEQQLNEWGVKYHELSFGKPHYDIWIDDKAHNSEVFFS